MQKRFFLIFLSFILSSCNQLDMKSKIDSSSTESQPDNKIRIKSSEVADNIKVAITGADPEKYTVQFSWPYIEQGKTFRIRLGNVLQEVKPNQTFFTHTVDHDQTLNYSFDVLDSNKKVEVTFRKTVIIPFDFVSKESNYKITQDQKIEANRIFITSEFPLTTNGHTVDILTTELHAQTGFIQTYPDKVTDLNSKSNEEYPTAADQKNGSSGGNLSIYSKKLFGRLKVYMRGERGGIGTKGDPILNRKQGRGTPAIEGHVKCVDPDPCRGNPNACLIKPKNIFITPRNTCWCDRPGDSGGIGVQGDKGKPGKKGMQGGDSGNVRVSINEYIPSEGIDPEIPSQGGDVVQIFQLPGPGGKGGPGGDGQKGSLGGEGANPNDKSDCRGPEGQEGKIGDTGDIGPDGEPGGFGFKCVYIGSEQVNECTQ